MRFYTISFTILAFVIIAAGTAPTAHAQALSNACRSNADCQSGKRCDMSNFTSGYCVPALSPTVQSTGILTPGGNVGGSQLRPGGNTGGENIRLINPLNTGDCTPNGNCLMDFLNKILGFVVQIGAIVVILMLVYVGYLFVVAQGDPGKITEARSALLWTVVGALILLGAQAISIGIQATVQAISVGS